MNNSSHPDTQTPSHSGTQRLAWPLLVFALVYPSILTWVYFILLDGHSEVLQQAAYTIGKAIQFGLPLVVVGLVLHQPLRWPKFSTRGLWLGIAFGLVIGGAAVAIYFGWFKSAGIFNEAAGKMSKRLASMGIQNPIIYAVVGLFYSLLHSLLEEYYWRWFVFGQLYRSLSLWERAGVRGLVSSIAISSIAFMAHHVIVLGTYFGWTNPWTYLFSVATAIGGAFWALLYQRSGSIYGPWASHLLIDAAIFGVGYDLMRTAI